MTVRSRTAALLASSCALIMLAGCGHSVDTAKQNFKRSTVPAADTSDTSDTSDTGGGGGGPTGHPVDPIYAQDKLRLVYPCTLVDTKAAMGKYGTPEQPELQDYNKCFFSVDGDDTVPRAYVTVDEGTYVGDDDKTTQIAGLTATADDTISSGTCFVEGLIQRDPDRSITLQVHWDGGNACDLGKTLLTSVVAKIKDGSSTYETNPANLVQLDPCAALTDSEATSALGSSATRDDNPDLHECSWDGDSGSNVRVGYTIGPDPADDTAETPKPVKINSVNGVSEKSSSGDACTVSWKHRSVAAADNKDIDPSWFELVNVDFDASGGGDPCTGALNAAKAVQSKLPAP